MDRLKLPIKIRGEAVRLNRRQVLQISFVLLVLLALAEWFFRFEVSLGLLYILPVVLAATVLGRRQIVIAAIACAVLRGLFVTQYPLLEQVLRFSMATVAYAGCGLLMAEISHKRRVILAHYTQLRVEQQLRRHAERQLRLLAESSPAAILTVDDDGSILAANRAAHEMLAVDDGALLGRGVRAYLPVLDDALIASLQVQGMRTSTSTWGRRADGSAFPADSWFSVYEDAQGRKLAAIVVDTSEDVREREYASYNRLLDYNRLLAGAVSHEIRNLCSAANVVTSNLTRHQALENDPDFTALRSLVHGLSELASFDLRKQARRELGSVRLQDVCTELYIIIGPDWFDLDGDVRIRIPADLPEVRGERHALLQVLLNLSQNALRAVSNEPVRQLTLTATVHEGWAALAVRDTGPGLSNAAHLFQPFRADANGSGLGLYISRALMNSLDGDLRHVPEGPGCCFELWLPLADQNRIAHD